MWRISGFLARALNRCHAANVQGCVHGEAEALNPSSLIPLGQNAAGKRSEGKISIGSESSHSGAQSGQNGQEQKRRGNCYFSAGHLPQYSVLDALGVGAVAVFFLHLARQVSFHCSTGKSPEERSPGCVHLKQILSSFSHTGGFSVRSKIVANGVQPCTWEDINLQAGASLQDADGSLESGLPAPSSGSGLIQPENNLDDPPELGSVYASPSGTTQSQEQLEAKEDIAKSLNLAASQLLDVTETSVPTVLNIFGIVSARDNADYKTAFHFFRESAEAGYSKAQYNTAVCYEKGKGVSKNLTKAAEYYRLAAIGGHQYAKYRYGRHLLQSSNEETPSAVKLLEDAADAGVKEAQAYLGVFYSKEAHSNPQKAARYFWIAAENGDVQSRYHLAVCYERGFGVPANMQDALQHYERAAKSGHGPAQQKLQEMQKLQTAGKRRVYFNCNI
ncbi:death ligand signal enhancer [Gastrophryne carolinensis]